MSSKLIWKAVAAVAAFVAAEAARHGTTAVWSRISDVEPPVNPADRSIDWGDAFSWALFAGLAAGLARVIARRSAAAAWEARTGQTPPGVRE